MHWKHKALRFTKSTGLIWASSFLYTAGLASLIPLFWISVFTEEFTTQALGIGIFAGILVISAIMMCQAGTQSYTATLRYLGYFSLIPALIAIILNFYSVDLFFATIETFLPPADLVRPVVDVYVDTKVPTLERLIRGYIVTGILLVLTSWYYKKRK